MISDRMTGEQFAFQDGRKTIRISDRKAALHSYEQGGLPVFMSLYITLYDFLSLYI